MKIMRIILITIVLCLALLLVGCGEKKVPEISMGEWNDDTTYSNEQFDINLQLPDGWTHKLDSELNYGDEISKLGVGNLVWATNDQHKGDVSIVSLKVCFNRNNENLKKYTELQKDIWQETTGNEEYKYTDVKEEEINGTKYYTFTREQYFDDQLYEVAKYVYSSENDFFIEKGIYAKTVEALDEGIGYFK